MIISQPDSEEKNQHGCHNLVKYYEEKLGHFNTVKLFRHKEYNKSTKKQRLTECERIWENENNIKEKLKEEETDND